MASRRTPGRRTLGKGRGFRLVLLEEISHLRVSEIAAGAAVVIIPISPLEEHGPHLPIGTDLFISGELSRAIALKIEERWPDVTSVVAPMIPLGAQAVPGAGSVSARQATLRDVLFEFIRGLARSHFRYFVLVSAHGSVGHLVALEEVAEKARRELGVRVEPALSAIVVPFLTGRYLDDIEGRMGYPLPADQREAILSDCHAGQWETGAMLEMRPDLVGEEYLSLPPILFEGWLQVRDKMLQSCSQGLGYVGAPAFATRDYANAASETLQEKIIDRVDAMLHQNRFRPSHTPFYYWPAYRSGPVFRARWVIRALSTAFTAGAVLGIGAGAIVTWRWLARTPQTTQE